MAKLSSMIGANVGRVEGTQKVNGSAIYGADVHFADTLWGKILRSPYAHARIKKIDVSKAWDVPGVKAIVTGLDEPNHYQGKSIRDIPVLCWDKVRFIGDKVAAALKEFSPRYNNGRRIDVVSQRLGYLVRSGDPDALDSIVPMAFGNLALDLILRKEYGRLVSIHRGFYDSVPITSVTSEKKVVDVPRYYNTDRLRPIYDFDGAPLFIMTSDY